MEQNDLNIFETKIDETGKAHLLETVRWTKFMAIMGFIFVGICLLGAVTLLVSGPMLSSSASSLGADLNSGIGIVYIIIAFLYVYPVYALLKFSGSMKRGLNSGNQDLINEGFRYQKTMYRYLGILTIISLFLVLISFILGGIGLMSR
jgi:hypothetical protein